MQNSNQSGEPLVYSYGRFSTKEQAKGRSIARQNSLAEAFALKRGLKLDQSLRMTDHGISAFKGDNIKFGALGAFLACVKSGKIVRGSILLVENIDRVTRMEFWDALEVVTDLVRGGVIICTLSPEMTYDKRSAANGTIYALIGQLNLGYEESKKKSERVRDAWLSKKKGAKKGSLITRRAPAWLEVTGDRKRGWQCAVRPDAAETILYIFQQAANGVGKNRLVKMLNAAALWKPGAAGKTKKWNPSYVTKVLRNRAVLGEYQPHKGRGVERQPEGDVVLDYYPRIISDELFYAAEKMHGDLRGRGGRTGLATNVFRGLVKCASCGGSLVFVDKGRTPKGGKYLACQNARIQSTDETNRRICLAKSTRYDEFESTVLAQCTELNPAQILPAPDEQETRCAELRMSIQGKRAKFEANKAKLKHGAQLLLNGGLSADFEKKFIEQMGECETEQSTLEADIRHGATLLEAAEHGRKSFIKWQQSIAGIRLAIKGQEGQKSRERLNAYLKELIDKIEVFSAGLKARDESINRIETRGPGRGRGRPDREDLAEGLYEAILENNPAARHDKLLHAFLADLTKRRMSKEGRFYRVHFKSGAVMEVVPKGSLAEGMSRVLEEDGSKGTRSANPDLNALFEKFRKRHGAAYGQTSTRVKPALT